MNARLLPLIVAWAVSISVARTATPAPGLLSVQFCAGATPVKSGAAAVGAEGDVWNRYLRGEVDGGFLPFGELTDLVWADGTASPVDLAITNVAGMWGNSIPDPMMGAFVYPLPNGNGSIRLWLGSVPAGHYDLYLYGRGATDDQVGVFTVETQHWSGGRRSVAVGGDWQALPLRESVHYVVFPDVPADGVSPILITVDPSPRGEAILNGLQLVQKDSDPPPVPPAMVVLPGGFAEREDDGYTGPLGTSMRLQNVYGASHFSSPIMIREIRYRRDGSLGPVGASTIDVRLRLSTTPKAPDALSAVFAENLGPDATVALDGVVTIESPSPGVAGGPQPFEILFPLTTPFYYDPSRGNLLVELTSRSTSLVQWTDGSNDSGDFASRAFAFDASAEQATYVDTGADIIAIIAIDPPLEIVPAGGYFATTVEVALRSTVEGGTIHLTLDGTGPSADSPAYAPPLTLATSTRVMARVFKDGAPASDVVSALFLQSQWNDGLPVAWRERYFGPAWFTKPEALALEDGDEDGANVYAEWLAGTSPVDGASKPGEGSLLTLAPATGEFEVVGYISAASFIPGGIVRYTLDGTDPGPASPAVEGGVIALTQTATVKARVFVNGNPVTALVSGSYTIRDIAPRITAQPAGRTVTEGGTTRFTVGVLGTAPLSYQWLHGGVDVAGATGVDFQIQPVGLGDAGDYTVRVSNPLGSVVSEVAKLTVIPKPQPPKIVRQPLHQSVVVGSPLTIAVEVTGTEPLSYAWYRNGFRITTATNGPSYTIPAVKLTDAANYWVRVTSPQGQATSSQARITVTEAAVAAAITTHPVGGNVPEGGDQALSVAATGTTPLAYQWFFNGQAIAGATTSELRLTGLTAVQAGTYWVSVSNLAGGAVSAPAVVQVTPAQPGGTVNLANLVSGVVDAPVFDRDGVTPLAGTAFLAQLFAGPTAGELAPVGGAVPFRTPGDGYVVSPNVITVTAVTPGAVAFVQMRVWESARGASCEAARLAGSSVGVSETLSVTTGGGGSPPAPPADLAGLKSFQLARETESPVVAITSPAAGNTADDRFVLAGSVTDNVAVAAVSWSWNGRDMGPLALADGAFAVPGLRLAPGENRFVVRATDTAGNAAEATGVAVFEPVRVLAVAAAGPVREGRRLATDLVFTSPGGVSGLTFVLRYDAARFRDPELAWAEAAVLAGALTQVNLNTPGELRATLSLPGGEFPAGPFALGVISLRARSVPAVTDTLLVPELVDLADRTGTPLTFGNAVVAAAAQITPRRLGGDNNGNDLLDVGDAALIQRFVALLEPPQSWDVTGNDLNENLALDSGDVVKVLRVVVGLDPAPVVPTRSGGTHRSPIPHGAVPVTAAALSASAASAWPGSQVTVRVALTGAPADLSGAALTLRYPPDRMRVSGADGPRAGAAVPAGVSSMFNVDPAAGTIRFAASGTQSWPDSGEPVLEVTFDLLAGASPAGWPVALSAGEVAWDDGYEVQALGPVELVITNLAPQIEPALAIADGAVTFRFPTEAGLNYAIQTSTDLESWEPLGQVTGTGAVLGFRHEGADQEPLRFYRIVVTGN